MQLITGSEMRQAERLAFERHQISPERLMERAGRGIAESLDLSPASKVLVIAGPGNNGGDGLVIAGTLKEKGIAVKTLSLQKIIDDSWKLMLSDADLLIDALFGTGLSRPVTGVAEELISAINHSGKRVVAVDIPSGLSADTGEVLGTAVRASETYTLGLPKLGLYLGQGPEQAGRVGLIDIGIPPSVYQTLNLKGRLLSPASFAPLLVRRPIQSHKGKNGHLLLVGGHRLGAILLAARAALRSGAGLVTVAVPKGYEIPKGLLEAMYEPFPKRPLKKILSLLDSKTSPKEGLAVGPGLGREWKGLMEGLLKSPVPMVLDADALNLLAGKTSLLKKAAGPLILTPHPGEFARLTGLTTKKIEADRLRYALDFASSTGTTLVLKGARTIIAESTGHYQINPTGNPGMATAGMGDVLTGMIGSFLVQGIAQGRRDEAVRQAALAGVYLHGLAGDRVSARLGDRGLVASDLIEEIPLTLKGLVS